MKFRYAVSRCVPLFMVWVLTACSTAPVPEVQGRPGVQSRGETVRVTLDYEGLQRYYYVHFPPQAMRIHGLPVVIVLHSGGGNPLLIEERTRFSDYADQQGFIVIYPAGIGLSEDRFLSWNAGYCCFIALDRKVNDVGFIQAVIASARKQYDILPDEIYVTGFSNGGMLAYRLAAETHGMIRAVAAVSAAIGGRHSPDHPEYRIPDAIGPVPMLIMHGMQDKQIQYQGGHGAKTSWDRVDLPLADAIRYWIKQNRCVDKPQEKLIANTHVMRKSYPCDGNNDLQVYLIRDGGHAWPGEYRPTWRLEYMLLDNPVTDFSATGEILKFFRAHGLGTVRPATGLAGTPDSRVP